MLNSSELMDRAAMLRSRTGTDPGTIRIASFQEEVLGELCEQVAKLTSLCAELVDFANERIRQSNEKCCQDSMHGLLSMLKDPELMMSFKASEDRGA